jgi:site-specific DNA recombinase
MIQKVELYPEKRKDGCWIRSLTFKFLIPTRGYEIMEFPLELLTTIESVVTLIREENC